MGFTDVQQKAFDAAVAGDSIVVAGPAGSGKSYWIKELAKEIPGLVLTATTGIAGVNIGGVTVHRFSGIGVGDPGPRGAAVLRKLRKVIEKGYYGDAEQAAYDLEVGKLEREFLKHAAANLVATVRRFPKKVKHIRHAKAVVVEECSMMSRYLFEVLDMVFGEIRGNKGEPFGGLQMIFVGDMRQMPPVSPESSDDIMAQFFFTSSVFDATFNDRVFVFDKIFRQQDPRFQAMLNRVADGKLTPEDIALFKSRVMPESAFPEDATRLYGTNGSVQRYNKGKLDALETEEHQYDLTTMVLAKYGGSSDAQTATLRKWAADNCIADKEITLKKGTLAMLLRNLDTDLGLANGTLGYVVGFWRKTPLFVPVDDYDPTIDYESGTVTGAAAPPSAPEDVRAAKRRKTDEQPENALRFTEHGALLVEKQTWEVTDYTVGKVAVMQVPLKPAWAITVHKSQGAQFTKTAASIDRHNCFCPGQAYVALSRQIDIEGLYLRVFDPVYVIAAPEAIAFYEKYGPSSPDDIAAAAAAGAAAAAAAAASA